jgi:hypothetical protein
MDSEAGTDRRLADILREPAMQRAMQMAERLREMQGRAGEPGQPRAAASHAAAPNKQGHTSPASAEAELAKLDPATRHAILKLPPQVRQELLQGMRDAGPDGYQQFIADYFKRLTEVNK